jgi:hypothetical protein
LRGRLCLLQRLPVKRRVLSAGVLPQRPEPALLLPEPSPVLPKLLLRQLCFRAGKPKGELRMLREELRRLGYSARREPLEWLSAPPEWKGEAISEPVSHAAAWRLCCRPGGPSEGWLVSVRVRVRESRSTGASDLF